METSLEFFSFFFVSRQKRTIILNVFNYCTRTDDCDLSLDVVKTNQRTIQAKPTKYTNDNNTWLYKFMYAFFYVFVQDNNFTYDLKPIKKVNIFPITSYPYDTFSVLNYDYDYFCGDMNKLALQNGYFSVSAASSSVFWKHTATEFETGFDYFGARYYASDLSVRNSVDPMSDMYPSTSPYMYVRGNPVMLVDPNGMFDDWFQNEKTGDLYYDSDMKKGDESKLGENWSHLGENGMFEGEPNGGDDLAVLSKNGGNPNLEKSGDNSYKVTGSFKGAKAKSIMANMGYDFNPTQQTIYTKTTSTTVSGPGNHIFTFIYGEVNTITEKSNYMKDNNMAIGKKQLTSTLSDGINSFPYTTEIARYEITYSDNWYLKMASTVASWSKPLGGTHDYRMRRNYKSWEDFIHNIDLIYTFTNRYGKQ